MMLRRLFVALALVLAAGAGSEAGILMDGELQGQVVKAELGRDPSRVLVTVGGTRRLVDLGRGEVYLLDGPRPKRMSARLPDDREPILPYDLRQWSSGPPVAGHISFYNVLQVQGRVCGEVLASRWMGEFVQPIVRAVEIVQRIDPRVSPKRREGCGAIPFAAFALNGWPLMAGWKDDTTFLTKGIHFDYPPPESLLTPPTDFEECGRGGC
ncbi:MAG TPA: hypothetical protein VFG43_00450 [Geminicoccaceae bacterium]|nr:hypothetical protein [Geminicoccaceae bacterium]